MDSRNRVLALRKSEPDLNFYLVVDKVQTALPFLPGKVPIAHYLDLNAEIADIAMARMVSWYEEAVDKGK